MNPRPEEETSTNRDDSEERKPKGQFAVVLLLIALGVGGWVLLRASGFEFTESAAPVKMDEMRKGAYPSPYAVACSPDGKTLYVSNHTALELAIMASDTGEVLKRIELSGRPAGLALSPDGSQVYVACAAPDGVVAIVDAAKGELSGAVPVGHTPTALALSPDGKRLYCCNRFDNTVSVIDVETATEIKRFDVLREPVAAVVTKDGKTLLVAQHLPAGPATGDYVAAAVSAIELASGDVTVIELPNGSTSLRGICLSPDGEHAYATHILAHYQLPTTQLERGWMNTNAMSIIQVADRSLVNTVLLDDPDLGAANPWGVACSEDGKSIYVTHAGTRELSIIDRKGLHERLQKVAAGEQVATSSSPDGVPVDLAFIAPVRQRVNLGSDGPRGLCVLGSRIFVAQYFGNSLSVVDLAKNPMSIESFTLSDAVEMSEVRRGELLFNDAIACFQHWQSCVSCHPDGRADGLNWDLLNDGSGNPKNSRSLVLAHRTPPVMSLAVRKESDMAIRAGFKHIQFVLREEKDLIAVEKFLESMRPVPSPALVNGELSEAAKRGKKIFKKAGCVACHNPPIYTTLSAYKLDHGTRQDVGKAFDTPTLVEAWRTGPYLYDGRAATLEEVFTQFNPKDKHGMTSELSADEIGDLVEYVRSL